MKKFVTLSLSVMMALSLVACGSGAQSNSDASAVASQTNTSKSSTVEIKDANGTVTVPVNPERVVSLDNRTFDTLSEWGVELVAAPKSVMPADSPYVLDSSVQDIGDHREPNLEIIAAADPELVIVGQRFASHYDDIVALVPDAAVINLNFDLSETAENSAENFVNGFTDTTTSLGEIFEKQAEAAQLIDDFDQSIESVKAAYNGEDTIMSVVVSGGNIGYSAPKTGRVWGPMYDIFGWVPSLKVDNTSSDHQGDEVSIEAIAQSNPDWILVLDRDAGTSEADSIPAKDVIDNSPALQNTTAIVEGNIIYAPNDTYTNESIQTYIELFNNMATTFSK